MKKLLVFIQLLIVLACMVLGILYLFGNDKLLNILEILVGSDLILMGISNYILQKKVKQLIIYIAVGVIILLSVILKITGVI